MEQNDQEIFIDFMTIWLFDLFLVLSFVSTLDKLINEAVFVADEWASIFRRHKSHNHLKQLIGHLSMSTYQQCLKLFNKFLVLFFLSALTEHYIFEKEAITTR